MPIPARCEKPESRNENRICVKCLGRWKGAYCFTKHCGEMPIYDRNRQRFLAKGMTFATLWKLFREETDICGKKILEREIVSRIDELSGRKFSAWPCWAKKWLNNLSDLFSSPHKNIKAAFSKKLSEVLVYTYDPDPQKDTSSAEYLGL